MEKLCICTFTKDGLLFIKGYTYRINYNPIDGHIYIHNIYGHTDISKSTLNEYFL